MNIVLIAHDPKKKLMQNFCIAYRGILERHDVYSTATTGRLVEEASGVNVHKFLAGHLGGVEQIATQIESNQMDMVIFLRENSMSQPHNNDYIRYLLFVIYIIFLLHLILLQLSCLSRLLKEEIWIGEVYIKTKRI